MSYTGKAEVFNQTKSTTRKKCSALRDYIVQSSIVRLRRLKVRKPKDADAKGSASAMSFAQLIKPSYNIVTNRDEFAPARRVPRFHGERKFRLLSCLRRG